MIEQLIEKLLLIEADKDAHRIYWSDKTNDPFYDSLIKDPVKAQKKNLDVSVKRMSPKAYLELAAKFDYPSTAAFIEDAYPRSIQHMKMLMLDPTKTYIDLPYIDFVKEKQEGRHRAMAAEELGVAKIPVLVIRKRG